MNTHARMMNIVRCVAIAARIIWVSAGDPLFGQEAVPWSIINGTNNIKNNNSGNVGVGTTTPGYKLDVVSGTANQARFQSTGTNQAGIVIDNATAGQQSSLSFRDAGIDKWQVNKAGDNSFSMFDSANARSFLTAANGNLWLQPNG